MTGSWPMQQYYFMNLDESAKKDAIEALHKLDNPFSLTDYKIFLGHLGMPGLTAYSSFYDIGQPKKGETIFISSAAGAVGQVVGILAKREGLKVIGSVGSDEKLAYIINELGFDGGFNYKNEKAILALRRLAPQGLDIYYDNVGGEQLDAAIETMNLFGRIVACGMISDYNQPEEKWYGSRKIMYVVDKRLTMRGFICNDANMGLKYMQEHQLKVGRMVQEGHAKFKVDVLGDITVADEVFVGMLLGKNFGKAVVQMDTSEHGYPADKRDST